MSKPTNRAAGLGDLFHDGPVHPDGDSMRRPLTRTERSLLNALLDHDAAGVAELRAQVAHATASSGCECGCGMIDLFVPAHLPVSTATDPVPVEGTVLDGDGEPIGGLLLFVERGRLAGLEVYSYDEPLPVPVAERVPGVGQTEPSVRPPR